MEKKLKFVLDVLLKAQDYTNNEMQAICDVDAMDSAKELFEELDEAIVKVKTLMSGNTGNEETYKFQRTWVGYQVKTKDDKFIAPYTDKDVFRSIEDAQEFIRLQRNSILVPPEEENNMAIESRWLEDEDEEKRYFNFHGKKNRVFEEGEKVWDDNGGEWLNVRIQTYVSREDEIVPLRYGNKNCSSKANDIYQLAGEKTCPRCGAPLCIEHHDEIDYPYYCPECQENFYNIEL